MWRYMLAGTVALSFGLAVVNPAAAQAQSQADIQVDVPKDAVVTINGRPTQSGGAARVYRCDNLAPGMHYNIAVTARIEQNGRPVERSQNVVVTAGAHEHIAIDFSEAAAKTQSNTTTLVFQPYAPAPYTDPRPGATPGPGPATTAPATGAPSTGVVVETPEKSFLPPRYAYLGCDNWHHLARSTGTALYYRHGHCLLKTLEYNSQGSGYYIYREKNSYNYWAYAIDGDCCGLYAVWFMPERGVWHHVGDDCRITPHNAMEP